MMGRFFVDGTGVALTRLKYVVETMPSGNNSRLSLYYVTRSITTNC